MTRTGSVARTYASRAVMPTVQCSDDLAKSSSPAALGLRRRAATLLEKIARPVWTTMVSTSPIGADR